MNQRLRHVIAVCGSTLLMSLFLAGTGCGSVDDAGPPVAEQAPGADSTPDFGAEFEAVGSESPVARLDSLGGVQVERVAASSGGPSGMSSGGGAWGRMNPRLPGHIGSGPAQGGTGPGSQQPGHGGSYPGNSHPGSGNHHPGHGAGCAVIDYDVVINRASDLRPYARMGCFDIRGHLFIQDTRGIDDLDKLKGLRSVSGYLAVSDNYHLKKVAFPKLEWIGEGLVIEGNRVVRSVEINRLEKTGGDLHIFNNPKLGRTSLAKLKKVGGDMIFAGLPRMTILQMPCLEEICGKFIYEHSQGLEFLCLPKLKQVGGGFYVHYNRDLKALLAPSLKKIGAILEIVRNPSLQLVDLGRLKRVGGDVYITHNFKWSQCQVDALMNQLWRFFGATDISDNNPKCRTPRLRIPDWCACSAGMCGAPSCGHHSGCDHRCRQGHGDCRRDRCGSPNHGNPGHHCNGGGQPQPT